VLPGDSLEDGADCEGFEALPNTVAPGMDAGEVDIILLKIACYSISVKELRTIPENAC
jgi:hypothetical protein